MSPGETVIDAVATAPTPAPEFDELAGADAEWQSALSGSEDLTDSIPAQRADPEAEFATEQNSIWNLEYEPAELGKVYANHKQAFLGIARNIIFKSGMRFDPDLAEEMVDEAFTAFYDRYVVKGAPLKGPGRVTRALCRTVSNKTIDHIRITRNREIITRSRLASGIDTDNANLFAESAEDAALRSMEVRHQLGLLAVVWPKLTEDQRNAILTQFLRRESPTDRPALTPAQNAAAKRGYEKITDLVSRLPTNQKLPTNVTFSDVIGQTFTAYS